MIICSCQQKFILNLGPYVFNYIEFIIISYLIYQLRDRGGSKHFSTFVMQGIHGRKNKLEPQILGIADSISSLSSVMTP